MPADESISRAMERSIYILWHSTGLVLIGILMLPFSQPGGEIGIEVGLLLAALGIGWRMFGVLQIRIAELIWLVAILGNFFGLCLYLMQDSNGQIQIRNPGAWFNGVLFLLVWFMGSVTNGLIIAQRLGLDSTSERIEMAGIFLMYPLGITGSLLFIPGMLTATSPPLAVFWFCGGVISILIWIYGRSIRQAARQAALAAQG